MLGPVLKRNSQIAHCCYGGFALKLTGFADDVKEGFDVHFAETFEDVYKIALDYDAQN